MKSKKSIKVISVIVVLLIIVWISMLTTDIICPIYFNRKPVFTTIDNDTILKDGGSAQYNGIAYSIQTHVRLADGGVNIENIEVKIFNIFKFTIHGYNHL